MKFFVSSDCWTMLELEGSNSALFYFAPQVKNESSLFLKFTIY